MALSDKEISALYFEALGSQHLREQDRKMVTRFAHAVESEVRKSDEALIRQLVDALEYHRAQTRPIDRTDQAITAGRARLEHADELAVAYMCGASREKELAAPQPVEREPLPGIKPGDFFGGRPEYAMEIDPDDFYGITAAIHHAIEMLNKHKDANTDWSPLDPKRSRRLQQALMAAWILEYPKEAAAHGIKGGQHGTE